MSEVIDGNPAGDGPANAGRPNNALGARARSERKRLADVSQTHRLRIRRLEAEHEAWATAQSELIEQLEEASRRQWLEAQAAAAEEGVSGGEALHGEDPQNAEVT